MSELDPFRTHAAWHPTALRGRRVRVPVAGRPVAAIACLTLVLAACVDSGLPHRNTPAEAAAILPLAYPVYEAARETQNASRGVYTVGARRFLAGGTFERIPHRLLRPIGMASGQQIMVLNWDREPFDRLYLARGDGTYSPLLRVP